MFVADLYQEMVGFGLGVFADGSEDSLQELQFSILQLVHLAIVLVIVDVLFATSVFLPPVRCASTGAERRERGPCYAKNRQQKRSAYAPGRDNNDNNTTNKTAVARRVVEDGQRAGGRGSRRRSCVGGGPQ
jgi:hypothetical protein